MPRLLAGESCGFCGPVFGDDDPLFRDEEQGDDGFVAYGTFRIPRAYWKIVVGLSDDDNLTHRAFRFTNPASEEPMSAQLKRNPADCQVDLAAIEAATAALITFQASAGGAQLEGRAERRGSSRTGNAAER